MNLLHSTSGTKGPQTDIITVEIVAYRSITLNFHRYFLHAEPTTITWIRPFSLRGYFSHELKQNFTEYWYNNNGFMMFFRAWIPRPYVFSTRGVREMSWLFHYQIFQTLYPSGQEVNLSKNNSVLENSSQYLMNI